MSAARDDLREQDRLGRIHAHVCEALDEGTLAELLWALGVAADDRGEPLPDVTLDADARDAIRRIVERRARPVATDKAVLDAREQVRSDAVDVVNALLRSNPGLGS